MRCSSIVSTQPTCSTRIGHIPGGGRPLLREGGPISSEARPSILFFSSGGSLPSEEETSEQLKTFNCTPGPESGADYLVCAELDSGPL